MTGPKEFFTGPIRVSAAQCDARCRLSMASIETELIIAATRHADALGVGYKDLLANRCAWVLSRMSIEMTRMPRPLETFEIVTWIESFNRHLSERNFAVLDAEGNAMGYARSVWACINIDTRRPASLTPVTLYSDRQCPIAKQPRLGTVENPHREVPYRFTYSDIDFNGHVNSVRYLEHIANAFDLDFHLCHSLRRIDIAYIKEAHYDQECLIKVQPVEGNDTEFDVDLDNAAQGGTYCRARLRFELDK